MAAEARVAMRKVGSSSVVLALPVLSGPPPR